jgi:hypothetical protein
MLLPSSMLKYETHVMFVKLRPLMTMLDFVYTTVEAKPGNRKNFNIIKLFSKLLDLEYGSSMFFLGACLQDCTV